MEPTPKDDLELFEKEFFNSRTALVVTNGKFNPPTKAHGKMIEHLFLTGQQKAEEGFIPIIIIFTPPKDHYISNNMEFIKKNNNVNTRKKTILSDEERTEYLTDICEEINKTYGFVYKVVPLNLMCGYKSKYKNSVPSLTIVVGSDRHPKCRSTWTQAELRTGVMKNTRKNNIPFYLQYGEPRNETSSTSNIANKFIQNSNAGIKWVPGVDKYSSSLFRKLIELYINTGQKHYLEHAKKVLDSNLSDKQKKYTINKTIERFRESPMVKELLEHRLKLQLKEKQTKRKKGKPKRVTKISTTKVGGKYIYRKNKNTRKKKKH